MLVKFPDFISPLEDNPIIKRVNGKPSNRVSLGDLLWAEASVTAAARNGPTCKAVSFDALGAK